MDYLKTRTPCCGRSVRVPDALDATQVCDRTCPKCRKRWRVITRPGEIRSFARYNMVEWTRMEAGGRNRLRWEMTLAHANTESA